MLGFKIDRAKGYLASRTIYALMGRNQYTERGVKKVCSRCGSNKTYVWPPRGWPEWRFDKEGNRLCLKCYQLKVYIPSNREKVRGWQKKTNAKFNPRRFLFKDVRKSAGKVPRKGECQLCHKKGITHLHHEEYDEADPLAHTIELCLSCHTKRNWDLEQYRTKKRRLVKPQTT